MPSYHQHYPGRPLLDAYGNGGFRFADMSHRGSLLILPSGVYGWDVAEAAGVTLAALAPVLAERDGIEVFLLGTGAAQVFPPLDVRQAFLAARLGLDVMDTGAAARTYNVLHAEKRAVAAALIAVE
jgi:uncharacterized protein